jgi:cytoskeletal protein CcmA (bactofilin family)
MKLHHWETYGKTLGLNTINDIYTLTDVSDNDYITTSKFISDNLKAINLEISGFADVHANMDISGALDVSQNIIGRKNITAEGNFIGNLIGDVIGDTYGKLIGDISGNTTIIGDIDMSGNIDLSGNMDISGTLDVSQNIIGRKTITAEGGFIGNLTGAAATVTGAAVTITTVGKIGEIIFDNDKLYICINIVNNGGTLEYTWKSATFDT